MHHFDLYSQALSKVERGFAHDLADVQAMIDSGLVEPELYRYPAIDPRAFRHKVDAAVGPR